VDQSGITPNDGFTIAAFAVDGELMGIAHQSFEGLSQHWIGVAQSFFANYGATFDERFQGPLGHLRIKCTSAAGAALILFYVHDQPASSCAIASGASPAAEAQVLAMFAESVRVSTEPFHTDAQAVPFSEVSTLPNRPLLIVVSWPDRTISEQDREIVKELVWHFGAAFLQSVKPVKRRIWDRLRRR
jgi:hypothetical protein